MRKMLAEMGETGEMHAEMGGMHAEMGECILK